ncbi:MAG: GTP cyclohydrolase II [Saprospiraceae bacterium]|nr:GTP cyclohydrolase II [Saprospiraceae bacterium]MBP7679744.1 GTP cyclohydrolase II [Saprospiraceae bacterium]
MIASNALFSPLVTAHLPTVHGEFQIMAFANSKGGLPHIVLVHPDLDTTEPVLTRLHSECMTGDIFGSLRCDCGEQLHRSLAVCNEEKGVLIYLRQEGRGIGLVDKLRAYNLQDNGYDTLTANTHLGFAADERNYDDAVEILNILNIHVVKLLTNNPLKVAALQEHGIEVVERIPIIIPPNSVNEMYHQIKKRDMGHYL